MQQLTDTALHTPGLVGATPQDTWAQATAWATGQVPDAPAAELGRGTLLGRYVVLDTLGAGGMGVVHRAYDPELDRKVAVKILRIRAGEAPGSDARTRLLREAQALARLSHPNVVAIHDVGAVGDQVWIAMEFVEGETLHAWLASRRTWREVVDVMQRAGLGLEAAHASGIVHRDFKPDNVMVDRDGRVRVMDLGLARAGTEPEHEAKLTGHDAADTQIRPQLPALDLRVTQVGAVLGTPGYMAPEQFKGTEVTARADIFAYCVTFWEALFGERPFAGATFPELAANVLAGKLRRPPRTRRVPQWLRQIVERGLASEPDRRWPSMNALLAELARRQAHTRRARIGAATVGVVGAALTVAFGLGQYSSSQARDAEADRAAALSACETTALAELAEAWSPTIAATIRGAFVASGQAYAPRLADWIAGYLDRYAQSWITARAEGCKAVVRGEVSAAEHEPRRMCLDLLRVGLAEATRALSTADATIVAQSYEGMGALGAPSTCDDPARLARRLRSDAPEASTRLRRRFTELSQRFTMQHADRDRAEIEQIAGEVRALGDRLLLAEILGHLAWIAYEGGDLDGAIQISREGYLLALADGADDLAIEAGLVSIFAGVHAETCSTAVLSWVDEIDAVAARGSVSSLRQQVRRLRIGANAQLRWGHADAAMARFDEALGLITMLVGKEHPLYAISAIDRSYARLHRGEYARAAEDLGALAPIIEAQLGPDHPAICELALLQAEALDGLGDPAGAEQSYLRALAISERNNGVDHPRTMEVLEHLGESLYRAGRYPEALARLQQALERALVRLEPEAVPVKIVRTAIARTRLEMGEIAEAEAMLRELVDAFPPDDPLRATVLVGLAEVQLTHGRARAALPLVAEAAALRTPEHARPDSVAEVRFLAARAAWESGQERGQALRDADAALSLYELAGPGSRRPLEAVRRWLNERRSPDPESSH